MLKDYGAGTYLFRVLVSKFYRGRWRNVTATAAIEATVDTPPSCLIAALALAKANPPERLLLTASAGLAELKFDLECEHSTRVTHATVTRRVVVHVNSPDTPKVERRARAQ